MNEEKQELQKVLDQMHNPDSLEIGTPAKGGAIKVYGNFNDPEAFKTKIHNAAVVRDFAQACIDATS